MSHGILDAEFETFLTWKPSENSTLTSDTLYIASVVIQSKSWTSEDGTVSHGILVAKGLLLFLL